MISFSRRFKKQIQRLRTIAMAITLTGKSRFSLELMADPGPKTVQRNWSWKATIKTEEFGREFSGYSMYDPEHALDVLRREILAAANRVPLSKLKLNQHDLLALQTPIVR